MLNDFPVGPQLNWVISYHRPPKLITQDGKVKFHPKSVNCDETSFESKFLIYHTKVKSTDVFLHDSSMIPPFPLLFFGGNISVQRDEEQDTIAVDKWIVFQAPHNVAKLVQVRMRRKKERKESVCVLTEIILINSLRKYHCMIPLQATVSLNNSTL